MTVEQDFETVRQQLMKAEWPHGGHGTLDNTLAALSRIAEQLAEHQRMRDPDSTIKPHGGIKTPTPCSTPSANPGNH
jgi:hypothetical protein